MSPSAARPRNEVGPEHAAHPGPEVTEDPVTYASWESFPASDAPGYRTSEPTQATSRTRRSIRIRRIYDPATPADGYRVLLDRIWPRGVTKEQADLDAWAKEIAVSSELRRWFGHDPARWDEFRRRYRTELQAPERQPVLDELVRRAREGTISIVYGAKDEWHNNAVVLAELLAERL
jgi:uncharacterized protein YeaO (DUF488 family)